jgi:hypothetical protein
MLSSTEMAAKDRPDIDAEIDRLYQLPLEEFVSARNDRALRARAEGDGEAALRLHSLAKPAVSAWAVNQLYWRARPAFDGLVKAGQALRVAQEATPGGRTGNVREAGRERDAALVAALERAIDLLQQAGHPATPAMRLRVATNLDALAAYGGAPPGAVPGRLVEDLEPPGFEVFTGIRPRAMRAGKPASEEPRRQRAAAPKVVSFEAVATARRAVADAERAASEKRAEAHRAAAALEEARADVKTAQAEAERAKSAWEEARRRVEQAERRVPDRENEAERARRAADEANQAVDRASATLETVRREKP